jgi:hypothetical protein
MPTKTSQFNAMETLWHLIANASDDEKKELATFFGEWQTTYHRSYAGLRGIGRDLFDTVLEGAKYGTDAEGK